MVSRVLDWQFEVIFINLYIKIETQRIYLLRVVDQSMSVTHNMCLGLPETRITRINTTALCKKRKKEKCEMFSVTLIAKATPKQLFKNVIIIVAGCNFTYTKCRASQLKRDGQRQVRPVEKRREQTVVHWFRFRDRFRWLRSSALPFL